MVKLEFVSGQVIGELRMPIKFIKSTVTFLTALQLLQLILVCDLPRLKCQKTISHFAYSSRAPATSRPSLAGPQIATNQRSPQLFASSHRQSQLDHHHHSAARQDGFRLEHQSWTQSGAASRPLVLHQRAERRASAPASPKLEPASQLFEDNNHNNNNNGKMLVCYYTTKQNAEHWPKDARQFVVAPENLAALLGRSAEQRQFSSPKFDFGGPLIIARQSNSLINQHKQQQHNGANQLESPAQRIDLAPPHTTQDQSDDSHLKRNTQQQSVAHQAAKSRADLRQQLIFGSPSSSSTLSFSNLIVAASGAASDSLRARDSAGGERQLALGPNAATGLDAPTQASSGAGAARQNVAYSIVGADGQEMIGANLGAHNGFAASNSALAPVRVSHQQALVFGGQQQQQQQWRQNNGQQLAPDQPVNGATGASSRQQQVVFASSPASVRALGGGGATSSSASGAANQLAHQSQVGAMASEASVNNELDTKSQLFIPAPPLGRQQQQQQHQQHHYYDNYGYNRRESAAVGSNGAGLSVAAPSANFPLYRQQVGVAASSSAHSPPPPLLARERGKSLQLFGAHQPQGLVGSGGESPKHRVQTPLNSQQQQQSPLPPPPPHQQLDSHPHQDEVQAQKSASQKQHLNQLLMMDSTPSAGPSTQSAPDLLAHQSTSSALAPASQQPKLHYPSSANAAADATIAASVTLAAPVDKSALQVANIYRHHNKQHEFAQSPAATDANSALPLASSSSSSPSSPAEILTDGAQLLAAGSSTATTASAGANHNQPTAQPPPSAPLVSSPLSAMFDVFGAASQYLMRFKPSALMSPSSFTSLASLGAADNHQQQLRIPHSSQQTLASLANSTSSSFSPLQFGSNLLANMQKTSGNSINLATENKSQLTSSARAGAGTFLARLTAGAPIQRREDVCGRTIQTPERRIIGGEGARYGEFPYQVHIKIAKHQCGGALVDRQSIVTAAHCVYHFITRAPVSKLQIVIGAYDIEDEQYQELPPQYFKVNKVKLHPNFRFSASHPDRYDIAILKLDKPVKYTDNVLPVCLPAKDTKFESTIGTVTGFGKTDPSLSNRYGTRLLQKVDVPIIENNECERWHRTRGIDLKIFPEMMCAGYEDGLKDACVGDSGGPLVVKTPTGPNGSFRWTLAGITSAGFGCAQSRQPGIYHRVSHTVDWIVNNLD